MTPIDAILLGAVQGATEFLPVSSSGHLILLRDILGINTASGLAFDAVLQLGTVLAVIVFFRRDIGRLIVAAVRLVTRRGAAVPTADRNMVLALIVGTIPAVILGLTLEKTMETLFRDALLVAGALVAGSALFVVAERYASRRDEAPTVGRGWWIGMFQALALVPGISRSGATISGGLLLGLTREAAARFAFLLSIPVIGGSGAKKLLDIATETPSDITWFPLALGFVTAFGVGLVVIRWLLNYLKRKSLMVFVWYRIGLAALVALVVLTR
ncbi:undecaprenyl-diphosphatase UppP [Patescibacteria group bacterium]|nr:undecaprenyl-diphosphatase UppP [Patescibacteria group bacterium]MBU1448742.1 undecaprenyl-diphosphatase UppP [Patescibacteria group bacterium]MBU2613719.1 undecaprenyl-diphosphatase UppP [Patescibacteria group bacterium]